MDDSGVPTQPPLPPAEERGGGLARGVFLVAVSLVAGVVALGVSQVPQPWRGWLVIWLLVGGTLALVVLRVLRHYYQYKTMELATRGRGGSGRAERREAPAARAEGLKVVEMDPAKGERHTLR